MVELCMFKNDDSARIPRRLIGDLFVRLMTGEKKRRWKGELNLVFVDNQEIRRLNREYRGKDKVTDVLSFNIEEPNSAEATFGEVYICSPRAVAQAREYGVTVTEELLRLACHGFLHLLGYDHENDKDSAKMRELEARYLTR